MAWGLNHFHLHRGCWKWLWNRKKCRSLYMKKNPLICNCWLVVLWMSVGGVVSWGCPRYQPHQLFPWAQRQGEKNADTASSTQSTASIQGGCNICHVSLSTCLPLFYYNTGIWLEKITLVGGSHVLKYVSIFTATALNEDTLSNFGVFKGWMRGRWKARMEGFESGSGGKHMESTEGKEMRRWKASRSLSPF